MRSRDVPAAVATRAGIVLWRGQGHGREDVAELAGVSAPTVDRWLSRYAAEGLAGLDDRRKGAPRERVPARVRARIVALTPTSPPVSTGLSHWSSREMAKYLLHVEDISVSWPYVAKVWRSEGHQPWRQGTFQVSKDPAFADKVADVVGLCPDPPGGAVVLSVDEKTQIQALDRTVPALPIDVGVTEKTHP